MIRTHQPDARGTDLRVTRLGFESIGPEAGSSLPTDEYGDSSNRRSPGREPAPGRGLGRQGDGRWQLAVREEGFCNRNANDHPSQVFTVKPVKVSAHAKGDPFGDTTHRF